MSYGYFVNNLKLLGKKKKGRANLAPPFNLFMSVSLTVIQREQQLVLGWLVKPLPSQTDSKLKILQDLQMI